MVEDGKVFGKGQRQQRGAAPIAGQLQQQRADFGPAGAGVVGRVVGVQRPAQPGRLPTQALHAKRLRMLGGGMGGQRGQRRPGIKAGLAQQGLAMKSAQHRQLLAQMAGCAPVRRHRRRQLRGTRHQPAQAGLHAVRRTHRSVEIKTHRGTLAPR